ncbi:MAG: hypothetical protein L7S01_04115, partial [Synechococcus sp. MOX_bin32]|nr:hypothetical protein [Synechococcus sp. MOX_bin32]
DKASNLLHLSSKHSHSKRSIAAEFDPLSLQAAWLLMEMWVRLFVLTPSFEGGRRLEHSLI